MAQAPSHPPLITPRRFETAADWLRELGDIPLDRIIFDPWPGTATEDDVLELERRGRLCELVDGTLVEKGMGYWESVVAMNLAGMLWSFLNQRNLGIVSGESGMMRLFPGCVRIPDVAFVSFARIKLHEISTRPIPPLYPDLAVEVLSENNTRNEIARKLREYFDCGTQLAWVIDPRARTASVYHRAGEPTSVAGIDASLDGEQVVPGFSAPMIELFRNVPEHF